MSARVRIALLGLVALGLLGVERPSGLGDVQDVRFWSYPNYTRVVIEFSRPVEVGDVRRLPADSGASRPERLYLDLPRIWVGRRFHDGIPVKDGLLQSLRLGQNTLSRSRLVIDLEHYERHRLITLRAPHRVVVDVYGARGDGGGDPGEASDPAWRLPIGVRPIQTVVIDPGHGGRDPGAIGLGGMREKDVNLSLAHALAADLRERGFRVVLTRKRDRFLSLEERTALAESERGDLFVSIHANASPRRATRGLEIYYLDESHQRHSLRVAARENGIPRQEMDSLQKTLARLRTREASAQSALVAERVHDAIMPEVSRAHPGFQDLGVKRGPFYVLFLSSMPAILVEAGFLTNRGDAKLLRDSGFIDGLAQRIAYGLERCRDDLPWLSAETGG